MDNEFGLQGLNGPEIIDHALAQLRKRLLGDCSLRPQDSYSRGYSAKFTYHIECYGLDKEVVDGEMETAPVQDDPDADVEHGELEIKQNDNIAEVRAEIHEDSDEPVEKSEEEQPAPGSPAVAARRKYTRKLKLASPGVIGGAEEFTE